MMSLKSNEGIIVFDLRDESLFIMPENAEVSERRSNVFTWVPSGDRRPCEVEREANSSSNWAMRFRRDWESQNDRPNG